MANEGNRNQNTSDLSEAFLAAIDKSLEKTHVADVCKVTSIDNNFARVQLINSPKVTTYAYIPSSLASSVLVESYVLVLYTDLDTRANLKSLGFNVQTSEVNPSLTRHSINNGIIILVL